MKKVKLIALFAAVILGLCIYKFTGELGKPADTPRTAVVVALVDIPENTKITAEMLMMREVATEALLSSHVEDIDSVVGMVTGGDIYAGEQIISERLVTVGAEESESNVLAHRIDEGMRAVTISVGAPENTISGMLKPGNRVDIYMYYSLTRPVGGEAEKEDAPEEPAEETQQYDENGNPIYSVETEYEDYDYYEAEEDEAEQTETVTSVRLVLQNVQIIALDGVTDKNGTAEYSSLTLQLSPEDTAKLILAEHEVGLRFVLRSSVDTELLEVTDTTFDMLLEDGEEGTEP